MLQKSAKAYGISISTHAPAGGATRQMAPKRSAEHLFLLTPLREGRHREGRNMAKAKVISTHAPAGGATGQRRDAVVGKIDFYSRPCGRGDRSTAIIRSRCTYFYSRPCGRGDAQTAGVSAVSTYFYSRPCGRGDDQWQYVKELLWKISTHAPAGGATGDGGKAKGEPAYISTHAPAGGATLWRWKTEKRRTFLLTPLREGRRRAILA